MTRVGIVMGAGGITGIAWLLGALQAVHERTNWDPADAAVMTGTSAGAVAATVLCARVDPERLLCMAERPEVLDAEIAAATQGRVTRAARPLAWPGSLALGLTGLVAADPRHRLSSLAGFLPRGLRSADEIRGLVHESTLAGWPTHTALRLHACDYRTGRLVSFGGPGAPDASLAEAVVASCAVPGYYPPVRIGAAEYVDGGLISFTHLDDPAVAECDVVLCFSPFASRGRGPLVDTALLGGLRRAAAWRVDREADRLRSAGTRVVLVEPAAAELGAMGMNVMDRARSRRVFEAARVGVGARLPALLGDVCLPSPAHAPEALLAAA